MVRVSAVECQLPSSREVTAFFISVPQDCGVVHVLSVSNHDIRVVEYGHCARGALRTPCASE